MAELEEENEEDAYDKYFGEITEQFEIESSKLTSVQVRYNAYLFI